MFSQFWPRFSSGRGQSPADGYAGRRSDQPAKYQSARPGDHLDQQSKQTILCLVKYVSCDVEVHLLVEDVNITLLVRKTKCLVV